MDWSKLRAVENFRVVKSMYVWLILVPIAAKATALIEGMATLTVFSYTFEVEVGLPFSWEAFYFSSIAFVLGNLAVIIRCPKIILDNNDYSGFKEQGKGRTHLFGYWADIGEKADSFEAMWRLPAHIQLDRLDQAYEERQSGTFWAIYEKAQSTRGIAKVFCTISYAAGFSLIAIVILQNLIYVVRYILQ